MKSSDSDYWELYHAMYAGSAVINRCNKQCSDPLCDYGCLGQSATTKRSEIMEGITVHRNQGGTGFPITLHTAEESKIKCAVGYLCKDPVCKVSGCMRRPAWRFREVIKLAYQERLMGALRE